MEEILKKYVPTHTVSLNISGVKDSDVYKIASEFDLLISGDLFGCCEECAKRRNRVYSISGRDKRFPQFHPYECSCIGLTWGAFIEELSYDTFGGKYVEYSNRPFVDDRTEKEKENYQYCSDSQLYSAILERDRQIFEDMKSVIPEFPFKSFLAYRRCNPDKKRAFADEAKKYGFDILPSDEEAAVIERYLSYKKNSR